MSSIGKLKEVVKGYLQATSPVTEVHALFSQGDAEGALSQVDMLILQAANNARKSAEMQHDFQLADVTVTGTIPTTGTGLDLSTVTVDGETVELKVLHSVCKRINDVDVPLRFESKQRMIHRLIERADRSEDIRVEVEEAYCAETKVLVHGWKLFLYPESGTDVTVVVDANRWLPEYTSDDDTDFILRHGFAYMQWACIVEVNHLLQTFVPRQEGSLSPPEKARDIAFEALVRWDSYMRESGRNIVLD